MVWHNTVVYTFIYYVHRRLKSSSTSPQTRSMRDRWDSCALPGATDRSPVAISVAVTPCPVCDARRRPGPSGKRGRIRTVRSAAAIARPGGIRASGRFPTAMRASGRSFLTSGTASPRTTPSAEPCVHAVRRQLTRVRALVTVARACVRGMPHACAQNVPGEGEAEGLVTSE